MERYPVITGWKSIWRNSPKIELQVYSIPIKILARFFVDKKQDYSKIYMKSKGTIIAKKKKNLDKVGGILYPILRLTLQL